MHTSLREWGRTGVSALREPKRAIALGRDAAFRVERKYAKRFSDVHLRQLRSLERSYSQATGPDLLVFGSSEMFWTTPTDTDHRHLVEMIRDELGPQTTFEALVGPLYNPRIVMAFLSALPSCAARPRAIVIPMSILTAQTIWLAHPEVGYDAMATDLRHIIASDEKRPRQLPRYDTDEAMDVWEKLPAPSLYGARCTVGELRLITNAVPTTTWQKVIRLRHLMDFYNAERLEPDSLGVRLAAELAAFVAALGVPSIAAMPPVNHEVVRSTLGAKALEQLEHNAQLLEKTYLEAGGEGATVVNAVFDSSPADYIDPVHLSPAGRARFAARIAEAAGPHLGDRSR